MKQNRCCECELFRALGDKTRYNIVKALLDRERCACELPRIVKRAQPTVSLQLKILKRAGLVSLRKDGKKRIYRIVDKRVFELFKRRD